MARPPEKYLSLPPRWKALRHHATQFALFNSTARFVIVEGPRRGGKTELALMHGSAEAMEGHPEIPDFTVLYGGPTTGHAKRLFWDNLKAFIPRRLVYRASETDLELKLAYGPIVRVVGMDEPRRIEGVPIDRCYFDEMAEMREGVFDRHIRPALSTIGRPGGGWFFGVPRIGHVAGGGKEFKRLSDLARSGKDPEWAYYSWTAEGLLDEHELAAARATTDPIIFAQEYLAQRASLTGKAYYGFERAVHAKESLPYKPRNPLLFDFDFNVEPGVAVVCQEHRFRERPTERQDRPEVADEITAVIGEVHIPKDSNTPSVCRKLIADWGKHEGPVWCYGDPAGGSRTTKIDGSGTDWTVIRDYLKPVFGERLSIRGPGTEDAQRPRVNALNARLRAADGKVRLLVDPARAPHVVEDFEETTIKPGSDGELHKPSGTPYTHWTDALGYQIVRMYPIGGATGRVEALR